MESMLHTRMRLIRNPTNTNESKQQRCYDVMTESTREQRDPPKMQCLEHEREMERAAAPRARTGRYDEHIPRYP